MGFGDFLKNAGKEIATEIVNQAQKSQEYRRKWENHYAGASKEELKSDWDKAKSGKSLCFSPSENQQRILALKNECLNRGLLHHN